MGAKHSSLVAPPPPQSQGAHDRHDDDDDDDDEEEEYTGFAKNPKNKATNQNNNKQKKRDCMPCFFLQGVTESVRSSIGRTADPIGSPLPETPLIQRKKRQQVQEALRRDNDLQQQQQKNSNSNLPNLVTGKGSGGSGGSTKSNGGGGARNAKLPVYSSKYGGLEKELSQSFTQDGDEGNDNNNNNNNNGNGTGTYDSNGDVFIHEGPHSEADLHEKYQLLEALGVGSTSTVHRCVNKKEGCEYACKIIDCVLIEERFQGMMSQFQTEIEALRQLKHPGIIQLYDVYLTGEKIYIVMELMEGGELFDYVVQKGTLTEEEASHIVRKVTSAMVYMHENNIVHRDLKPENLLLKRKPNPNIGLSTGGSKSRDDFDIDVKIIDFGLSKAMVEPVARTFLGTRGYLAPEMLQRRDYTKAVDTWALGVIVFVLVCGCLPFDDDSATVPSDDLVRTKFTLRFPRWAKNLSTSARDLLAHLLDVNPMTRYTAEQALRHPWVQGQSVPKGNLLASPGRIKTSPAYKPGQTPNKATMNANAAGKYIRGTRKQAPDPQLTPPQEGVPMVRKTSL